ncbi:hypothetical protein [Streptomyces canus]|uniref:hypothetical protein n=1 Tax=Streptomyces canus TaxID=58343 RepID=UPI00371C3150
MDRPGATNSSAALWSNEKTHDAAADQVGGAGPEFTDALAKNIEAKREEKPFPEAPEPEKPGKVLDLMAALKESVQQAKASRGEDADVHEMPKKKKTTKKQPAKKTAAKKATKKTTARRSRSA